MPHLIEKPEDLIGFLINRPKAISHAEAIELKERERASFRVWVGVLSGRINEQLSLPEDLYQCVAGSERSIRTIYPEEQGHIGERQRLPVYLPDDNESTIRSTIDSSFPHLWVFIDHLARLSRFDDQDSVLRATILAATLSKRTFDDNLAAPGDGLGESAAVVEFEDGRRDIRLNRSLTHLQLEYYSGVRIREQLLIASRTGKRLRPREADCRMRIAAVSLPLEQVDKTTAVRWIFPWVYRFVTHPVSGSLDSIVEREEHQLGQQVPASP